MINVGVIIGRFQVPYLSEGHQKLIRHVETNNDTHVILVGSSQASCTMQNPLDYQTRERMLRGACPDAIIQALPDFGDAEKWSERVDSIICSLFETTQNTHEVTIYGGRLSCLDPKTELRYIGGFATKLLLEEVEEHVGDRKQYSGTELRESTGRTVVDSEDFRCGVIWCTQNMKK